VNARTKIFIAEYDCAKLIQLMLWLEQFPEFEVSGTAKIGCDMLQKIKANQPDVVLIDFNPERIDALQIVRALRYASADAAIIATASAESGLEEGLLNSDADEILNPASSIKDLCESIRKVVNRHRATLAAANVPMTKAG
jgi:DNA-binding NarL/FixJ family response regulator